MKKFLTVVFIVLVVMVSIATIIDNVTGPATKMIPTSWVFFGGWAFLITLLVILLTGRSMGSIDPSKKGDFFGKAMYSAGLFFGYLGFALGSIGIFTVRTYFAAPFLKLCLVQYLTYSGLIALFGFFLILVIHNLEIS